MIPEVLAFLNQFSLPGSMNPEKVNKASEESNSSTDTNSDHSGTQPVACDSKDKKLIEQLKSRIQKLEITLQANEDGVLLKEKDGEIQKHETHIAKLEKDLEELDLVRKANEDMKLKIEIDK